MRHRKAKRNQRPSGRKMRADKHYIKNRARKERALHRIQFRNHQDGGVCMALRKGIFFTIDALLASGIVILSIALLFNFYSSKPETTSINYASHDIVGILSTMKVGDINNEYAKSLILSGDIEKVNNTVLEQIGDFWANGEDELSYNFTRNVTEGLVPQGFGFSVLVNGDEIYSRNLPISNSLVTSRNIISGISKTQPTEGFTS